MSPTLKTILMGAALATATPITPHVYHTQHNDVSLATNIFPDGFAPIFMAQVADPPAELAKCDLEGYIACLSRSKKDSGCRPVPASRGCTLGELMQMILDAESDGRINVTGPVYSTTDYRGAPAAVDGKAQNASAAALERRQEHRCGNHCAGWAAAPPWGTWFAVCMLDCHVRCKNGGKCP